MPLARLVEFASRHPCTPGHGTPPSANPVPGLWILRQESPSAFEASLYEPVLCVVLEGRKEMAVGESTMSFGPGECLLVSVDLPVRSRITRAPYQSLVFELDVPLLRKLRSESRLPATEPEAGRAAETHRADPGLLDALQRYLALAGSPADAKVLGPLTSKEIHYRLLTATFGGMLRQLVRRDSAEAAISRAIGHIRDHVRDAIVVPELARRVGMSASSFHKHFRTITATTPLQYQKELRLLEARRMLTSGDATVTTAAYEVGYESPSQFSREYARKFGVPPSRDAG